MSTPTSFQDFEALHRQGFNRIPLVRRLPADLDTPVSAYLKLVEGPRSFLLESVVGGERFGRFSIIGLPCTQWLEVQGRRTLHYGETGPVVLDETDPLATIEAFFARFKAPPLDDLPRFCGGLAGYFGYDTIRLIEPRLDRPGPRQRPDPIGVPDIRLLLTESLAVFDNLKGTLTLVVYADPTGTDAERRASYLRAEAELDRLVDRLRQPLSYPADPPREPPPEEVCRDFSREAFEAAVCQAKELIAAGDLMQVVLAQQIRRRYQADPLALYRAMRSLNPSPYLYFYDFGDFQIIGASPEILVRQDDQRVIVRPIAGTRPRGASREEDLAMEADLRADAKECAEHLMLIDLARNDVGRIAEIGTVRLTEKMGVERYSHVMHLVSEVEGTLKAGLGPLDVLRAAFPAGTLSGAPKIRAMEIIDEFEPVQRGVYGGACGYLSFSGQMDLAIAIRTGILKDGWLTVQAGAGVVADSVPASEWLETENKARAVLRAAEIAEKGLSS